MKCKYFSLFVILLSACTNPKLALDTTKVSSNELLDYIQVEQDKIHTLDAKCRISVDSEEFSGNFFANVYQDQNFFQFPLQLRELINIFAGKEILPSMKISEYKIVDDQYFIKGQNGGDNISIWIDHNTGRIKKITRDRTNRFVVTREYDDFIKSGNLYFPRKIKMVKPDDKQAVSVFYTHLTLNEKLDRENFLINVSDQAEQIYLSR
jgi:hypothetical protein